MFPCISMISTKKLVLNNLFCFVNLFLDNNLLVKKALYLYLILILILFIIHIIKNFKRYIIHSHSINIYIILFICIFRWLL